MARRYHPCLFCKGNVKETKVTVDYRWGEEFLVVLKDVPAGVCEGCGEQYFKAEVVKAMEKSAQTRSKARKTIQIPVRKLLVA